MAHNARRRRRTFIRRGRLASIFALAAVFALWQLVWERSWPRVIEIPLGIAAYCVLMASLWTMFKSGSKTNPS